MTSKPWTEEECAVMREMYPHVHSDEVALRLGRPYRSVVKAAFKMGIKKTPEYLRQQRSHALSMRSEPKPPKRTAESEPAIQPMMRQLKMNKKFSRAPSQVRLERVRELLKIRPITRAELMEKLACSLDTVCRYLRYMRRPNHREIHIEFWERNLEGGHPTAFYAYGGKKDAPKPTRYKESQRNRRYRKKMMQEDPAKYMTYLERAKHHTKERRRKKKGLPLVPPDPMLAWIPRRKAA